VDKNLSKESVAIKNNHMKIKNIYLTLVVLVALTAVAVKAASIQTTIANINADASKPGGQEQVLKSISASTHVPVATLEKQKAKSGLSYGDLYAAHAIAKASGKSFEDIATLKTKGQTWDTIAAANNVSLDGKKSVKQTAANANPSPTPEVRSMRQQQADRFAGRTEVTNAPKPKATPH
jgi:BioD-like phosphotransacetylase family protein